jgi:hypothetical protein
MLSLRAFLSRGVNFLFGRKPTYGGKFLQYFFGIMMLAFAYETLWLRKTLQEILVNSLLVHIITITVVSALYAMADCLLFPERSDKTKHK